jgi:hypothetical protein
MEDQRELKGGDVSFMKVNKRAVANHSHSKRQTAESGLNEKRYRLMHDAISKPSTTKAEM